MTIKSGTIHLLILAGLTVFLSGFFCKQADSSKSPQNEVAKNLEFSFAFDQKAAAKDLEVMTTTPHPFGSEAQKTIHDFFIERLTQIGLDAKSLPFESETPNPILLTEPQKMAPLTITKKGYNIFARAIQGSQACVILIGTHYDTKTIDNGEYLGANDSGSSTVGLLHLLKNLKDQADRLGDLKCSIAGLFIDGEEAQLPNWNDGIQKHPAKIIDNRYGSRDFANKLKPCDAGAHCLESNLGEEHVKAFLLMDMIGSKNLTLTLDTHSDQSLKQLALRIDDELFESKLIHRGREIPIEDDHISFIEVGVPAIDLIDFANISTWHQPGDTLDTISYESISNVVHLTTVMALELSQN